MIDSGSLRHRVRIERLVPLTDSNGDALQDAASGELLRAWQSVAEVWAAIRPVSVREFVQSQALQSEVTARIVVRWRADLEELSGLRLVHLRSDAAPAYYNPAGALPDLDSGREYITVPCSRGLSDGR